MPVEPEIVEMACCDAQELGTVLGAHRGARASQTIPPAVRRRVLRRDGGRCVVPGCTHGTFVDIHHLNPREEGGDHSDDNLVTLCGAHHRALHLGKLVIEGPPSNGLVFRHADGTIYGSAPDAARTDVAAKVFSALVGQGFAEKQARNALAKVSAHHPEARSCEQVLRAALRCLTEKPGRAA